MKRWFLGFTLLSLGCAVGVDAQDIDQPAEHEGEDAAPTNPGHDAALPAYDAGLEETAPPLPPPTSDASISTCTAATGTLVTYDFTGQPGNQTSTAAKSTMSGVSATALSRAAAVNAVSGANSINSSNWSTSGIDATRYYTFTVTPPSGCTLDVTSIAIDTKTSTTGPTGAALGTSADTFASTTSFALNTTATATLTASSAKALEIRVYGFDASSAAGTSRIENTLTVSGSVK